MNVAARVQYPGAGASGMSPPNTKPIRPYQSSSPRDYEFDDRALHYPKTNAQFDSHDDFYAFLENNRSALQDPNANAIAGMPSQQPQMHLHQQQQQRQGMPANQQLSGRPRAPSYSTGSQSEEMLVAKTDAKKAAAHRQQTGRRPTKAPVASGGQPRPDSSSKPSEQHSPGKGRQHSSAGGPPTSQSGLNGAAIQRLKTPSLMDSVLHPLDQKVREYGELMRREQEQMDRLDEELRVLHERRAEAEARFLEAKGKHDDFRRRHEDVERAMRGEPPLPREPMPTQQQQQQGSLVPPPLQHQQRPAGPPQQQAPVQDRFPRPQSMALPPPHDYEDDVSEVSSDEEERPRPGDRRVQSQHSFGKPPPQQKRRFRMSLFG